MCGDLAANFTAYTELKRMLFAYQPQYEGKDLPSWQTGIIGLISGACGPFTNGEFLLDSFFFDSFSAPTDWMDG